MPFPLAQPLQSRRSAVAPPESRHLDGSASGRGARGLDRAAVHLLAASLALAFSATTALASSVARLGAGPADALAMARMPNLRTLDLRLTQLVRRGYVQSPTFRTLVDDVEASTVVVYLERHERFGGLEAARLRLAGEGGGLRFVKVSLRWSLSDRDLLVYLAHELQHVREIAERPEVVDQRTLREFYCRVGYSGLYGYDTDAARAVAEQVAEELITANR